MYDLQKEIMVHFRDPSIFLYLHIPRRALVDMAYQEDAAGANYSAAASGSLTDPVVRSFGGVPAACAGQSAPDQRLVHRVCDDGAADAHPDHYIGTSRPLRRHRSGLTARQLRIAKQAISENLDGGMPLDAIARECGLSQSHFTRAFVNSVGQPPHQWLLERRVDLARHLLSESVLPLADIAIQCGFADQSHFTACSRPGPDCLPAGGGAFAGFSRGRGLTNRGSAQIPDRLVGRMAARILRIQAARAAPARRNRKGCTGRLSMVTFAEADRLELILQQLAASCGIESSRHHHGARPRRQQLGRQSEPRRHRAAMVVPEDSMPQDARKLLQDQLKAVGFREVTMLSRPVQPSDSAEPEPRVAA